MKAEKSGITLFEHNLNKLDVDALLYDIGFTVFYLYWFHVTFHILMTT